ncbi:MAG: hypothetical protein KatS3mg019_0500 [Fimbriimonadales bacterium]|nr:MAG: hypothetical protein KatS3mg019_0500 [Fimbriimonadales bacterium]
MECGSRLKDDTLDPLYAEGSDREIYPELARANLLRMQGNYDEAIDICRRIMGRFPSNETVHALLGDIYTDQGKLEDAIQWYELLVELAPSNVHYSAKLHNLRAMHAAQVAPPPPIALSEPEPKPAKPKALAYSLFGLLALILVIAAFVAGTRLSASREAEPKQSPNTQASLSPAPTTEPVRVPPPASAEPSPPPALPTTSITGFTGMSAAERNLGQKLSQRLNGAPIWCAFDPATNRWQARIRIQSGVLSKQRVLQEAIALARAFYEQYPSAGSLSVAVIAPSSNADDVLVFSGEIAPQLTAVDPTLLSSGQAEAILQQLQVWWNPTIQFQD